MTEPRTVSVGLLLSFKLLEINQFIHIHFTLRKLKCVNKPLVSSLLHRFFQIIPASHQD